MRRYDAPVPPSRTYGKTAAGWASKSRNLWAEVEAEEEARRQQERERAEAAEEKKRVEEEEERRRRKKEKKERKKEKKRREEEERGKEEEGGGVALAEEYGVEGLVEEVRKLRVREDGVDTPPTSPEKDTMEAQEKEEATKPAAASTPPPKKQPRRATIISTTPLSSPRPEPSHRQSDIAIATVPPTPGPPPPLDTGKDGDGDGEDSWDGDFPAKADEGGGKSDCLSPALSTSPFLTPDRRGGLRRKSSRLTLSPEPPRSVSAVTPAKIKAGGVAIGEYEAFSDGEVDEEKEEKTSELDPPPPETQEEEFYDAEEDDWSEWGKSIVTPEELNKILSLCTVQDVLDFSSYIQSSLTHATLSKLGEASYSEVFLQTPHPHVQHPTATPRTVLKIIPFGYPTQCPLSQIHDELLITATMSPLPGFIGFHSAHVVRGAFPAHLLELWDHWDLRVRPGGSENDRPDFYGEAQLFAVIGLEDGGRDLEGWRFGRGEGGEGGEEGQGAGWEDAREVFWRVAGALARGEREREFEHRDLHFGNIVIKRVAVADGPGVAVDEEVPEEMLANLTLEEGGKKEKGRSSSRTVAKKQEQQLQQQQQQQQPAKQKQKQKQKKTRLQVSLIDYTLSRARSPDGILSFTPLEDEALFEGKGDYQFEIYRLMKSHLLTHHPPLHHNHQPALNPLTGLPDDPPEDPEAELDWSIFLPATNLYWLHYLLHILLYKKRELKKPPPASSALSYGYGYGQGVPVAGAATRSSRAAAAKGAGVAPGGGGGGGSGSGGVAGGFSEEEVRAFRELEGLYRVLDCRPKAGGGRRGGGGGGGGGNGEDKGWGSGSGSGWVVREREREGVTGFVEWAVERGLVGVGEL